MRKKHPQENGHFLRIGKQRDTSVKMDRAGCQVPGNKTKEEQALGKSMPLHLGCPPGTGPHEKEIQKKTEKIIEAEAPKHISCD